ncbi:MAG: MmcQ/YjbR family DNA-binding protein [Saprospiraceae bacterium]|nr:MmcQ/YjbR family DNA-binding protein [Saprospiraceae bacterium]
MITFSEFRSLAFTFPDVTESPHFEKTSFRLRKKIFATYAEKEHKVCLKLSEADQSAFTVLGKTRVSAVPNKWGSQGWTFFELSDMDVDMMRDALACAYAEVETKRGTHGKNEQIL